MKSKGIGKQTLVFTAPPHIVSAAAIVGDVEGEGPLADYFDVVLQDDIWGEESWEKAERKMFEHAVRCALDKAELTPAKLDCLLGGDLLNQIISANFAARELQTPFLGLYGACSTMAESLLIGSMLVDGGYAACVACAATSHFSTAERQYRQPLEMGGQTTPTAQRTVTGAGCSIVTDSAYAGKRVFNHVHIPAATIGRVVDLGITDAANMGAAMAPAAADTLCVHLGDTGRGLDAYDLIVTGDLGTFGSEMFLSLCGDRGLDVAGRHFDCGCAIFGLDQKVDCGGSGCGCSASVLNAYLLRRLEAGELQRILFMATGALLSTTSGMQNDSIPGIAHGVVLERK
ncbi:MAG: stage V sporulation protein AD [Christensenellaceae bacterium]|jgi:stage V sporulation protein AD|nr:stage V sporulation protein AD [Christensenellaceae bacterium]